MELEKNTYGLSEGVFKSCQFLGLELHSQFQCEVFDLKYPPV